MMYDETDGHFAPRHLDRPGGQRARHALPLCANTHPLETQTARKRRRYARLDRLSRADPQRDIDRDEIEPSAATSPDMGVREGDRLCVAGDRRPAALVPPSTGRGGDRRVPARRDGRAELAVPLPDRLRRSLRIQQRPAIEPRHRRRTRVHRRRARATALPRPRNRKSDLEARPGQGVSRPSGLLRERFDAPDRGPAVNRECRRAGRSVRRRVRQDNRQRSMEGRQGVGRGLRLAGSCRGSRTAARPGVRRRRIEAAGRWTDVDRSIERSRRFRVSMAKPHVRIRQRLLPRRLRQQGVRLRELSSRRRAGRDSARTSVTSSCGRRRGLRCISTHPFTRMAISTGSMDGTSPMRRWRASMPPAAKSYGARHPNGEK